MKTEKEAVYEQIWDDDATCEEDVAGLDHESRLMKKKKEKKRMDPEADNEQFDEFSEENSRLHQESPFSKEKGGDPRVVSIRGRAPGSRPIWSQSRAQQSNVATSSSAQSSSIIPTQESLASVVPQAIEVSDAEPVIYAVAKTMSSKSLEPKSEDPPPSFCRETTKSVIILFACIIISIFVILGTIYALRSTSKNNAPVETDLSHNSSQTFPPFLACKVGDEPPDDFHSSEEISARFKALVYLAMIYQPDSLESLILFCSARNRALQWLANDLNTWVPPPIFFTNATATTTTNTNTIRVTNITGNASSEYLDNGNIFIPVNKDDRQVDDNRPNSGLQEEEVDFLSDFILPGGCRPRDPCNQFGIPNNETYQIVQRYAMAVLYFSSAVPHWKSDNDIEAYFSKEHHWLSSSHVCMWEGVNCSDPSLGKENVTAIDLSGLELSGQIPVETRLLFHLVSLDMSNNHLTGIIPWKIGRIRNLEFLHLENNRLIGRIGASIGTFTRLVKLTLQNNRIRNSLPTQFGSLANLEELILSNNSLVGKLPKQLGNMSSLALLDLRGNKITGSVPQAVCEHFNSLSEERTICRAEGMDCPCCTDCI